MATLAILSALAEEQQGLLACLSQPVCLHRAGREIWRGQWNGHTVLLALSRIGKVAAATTATALIDGLGAGQVVFTGVAGGIGPGVQAPPAADEEVGDGRWLLPRTTRQRSFWPGGRSPRALA